MFLRVVLLLVCINSLSTFHLFAGATSAIYFKANGTDPAWDLVVRDNEVAFTSTDKNIDRLSFPGVEPVKSNYGDIKTYTLKNSDAEMTVEIAEMLCQNANSRERFPYSVTVTLKRSFDKVPLVFSGCGLYVPDSRLQGRWMIVTIRGDSIPSDSLFNEKKPYLELGTASSYFTAWIGCEMVSGRLYFERNLFRFTDFVVPKDPCDHQPIQKTLVSALQFTTQYLIRDDELILGNPTSTTVVLRKQQ